MLPTAMSRWRRGFCLSSTRGDDEDVIVNDVFFCGGFGGREGRGAGEMKRRGSFGYACFFSLFHFFSHLSI